MGKYLKHETIACERCGTTILCKANANAKCDCSGVPLTLNETQYISELYDNCLCIGCLIELKKEYLEGLRKTMFAPTILPLPPKKANFVISILLTIHEYSKYRNGADELHRRQAREFGEGDVEDS